MQVPIAITRVPLDSSTGAAFVEAVQQEYIVRYGGRDQTPVDPAEFVPPQGDFLVASVDGAPVGCGGFRTVEPDVAEIKRMYVAPAARGRGVARALLRELEESAAAAGCRQVILETGSAQPEAVALYESSGYVAVPGFGFYRCYAGSRHFGKPLALPAGRVSPG